MSPTPRRLRRVSAGVAVTLAVALGTGLTAGQASADVTVPACPGTVSTTVNPSLLTLTGTRESSYENGDVVVLYTNDGTFSGGDRTPACAVHKVNGVAVSDWAYCTDLTRAACIGPSDPALAPVTGNPKFAVGNDPLGPDKEQVIAFLAQHSYPVRNGAVPDIGQPAMTVANNATSDQRHALQLFIWCVSEAGPNVKVAGWAVCAQNFTSADFDAVLALIPVNPTLEITSPSSAPLEIGQVARFTVGTNVVEQPIVLTRSANATWAVCDGDATLTGDDLIVHGTGGTETVTLCATATAAGPITIDATSIPTSDRNLVWSWNGSARCQIFATFMSAKVERLTASGTATVRAPDVPTTPGTPTTPTAPTTPTTPVAEPKKATRISTLRLTKVSAASTYKPGQTITYRIKVSNPSSTAARNVRVCDTMPRGLVFVGASPKAQLRNGRHCWTIKSLGAKKSASFRLEARVSGNAPSQIINRVSASAAGVSKTAVAKRTVQIKRAAAKAGGVTG